MSHLLRKIVQREAEIGFNAGSESEDSVAPLKPPMRPLRRPRRPNPRSWSEAFNERFSVDRTDSTGQVCGTCNVYYTSPGTNVVDSPVFVFCHGGGSSALTFGALGHEIRQYMASDEQQALNGADVLPGLVAIDLKGHGLSSAGDGDFSIACLVQEFANVVDRVWERSGWSDPATSPGMVLVGHSLGGAIVSHAAHELHKRRRRLVGTIVLDVVEGPTVEALGSMMKILKTWPPSFGSMDAAIDWHLSSGTLRNRHSAELSVPGVLRQSDDGRLRWIMDLAATEPHWLDWFQGMSQQFLKSPGARLLILAGTDRLDKELMVGQMQGKYQLVVFTECGHFLHEDDPRRTAVTVVDFWVRNGKPVKIVPTFGKFGSVFNA